MSSRRSNPNRNQQRQAKGFQKSGNAIRKEIIRMQEPKRISVPLDTGTISSTPTLLQLNTVAQGSAYNQRIGDQIQYKSLTMRMRALEVSASGGSNARFMLILWKENSTPTGANILDSTGDDTVLLAPKAWDDRKKFSILWDSGCIRVQAADKDGTNIFYNNGIVYHSPLVVKPLVNLPQTVYDTASSTASNQRLYFLYTSDSTNNVSVKAEFRLTYTDS